MWILLGCTGESRKYEIYAIAALIGSGGSAMLITSLAMVASFIGSNLGMNDKVNVLARS